MRYSKMFGKSVREAESDMKFKSDKLLYQAGYVRESVPGRYFFLPLGMRVKEKLMAIMRDEMERAGSQQILTPTLHPLHLWEETNRDNAAGFELMKIVDRRGDAFVLGGTAEEMVVDLVRKFNLSYKDMPFSIYQFSQKFRDELRARGGLLRVREFTMKDAYSFHVDEADFEKEYEAIAQTYSKIFYRMGLLTSKVAADSGYIGGDYSHEYIADSDIGESVYFVSEDGEYVAHEDIAEFKIEDVNLDEELKEMEVIEQPEWVKTMDDNVKHYGKDPRFFLKNVVYRNSDGDLIIATIRGDLQVNKIKLQKLVGAIAGLEEASDEDLEAIGTKSGSVHSWGHKFLTVRKSSDGKRDCEVIYVADSSLQSVRNFTGGQKEDTTDTINVNYGRDFKHDLEGDIATADEGLLDPSGKSRLTRRVGIEVGNIFQLGYHYSNMMKDSVFMSKDGKPEKFYMGCYGIGVGRTMAAIAQIHNDQSGIIWPISVAPYQVHMVSIDDGSLTEQAETLYRELTEKGFEVLWDDRSVSPGIKFSDADLVGVPIRIVLSKKSLEAGGLEVKLRNQDQASIIAISEIDTHLAQVIADLYSSLAVK